MPNTPALVGEGMTGVCANDLVTEEELQLVLTPPEKLWPCRSCSGVSDGYRHRCQRKLAGVRISFLEALADAAVAEGMPRKQAYEFAAQSVPEAPKCFSRQECTWEN